jgi:hypothetical protein
MDTIPVIPSMPLLCPQCHQPILPTYYFCPNCGKKLNEPGLSTTVGAQAWLYAFSIVLPIICFLAVTKWQGIKYAKSLDPKARQIGYAAIALLTISTIVTFWYAAVWINQQIQAGVSQATQLESF